MAINDVLPLKAARRDAITNLKFLWASSGHEWYNFDRFVYIRFEAPPYVAGTIIIASVYEGWVKNSIPIFGVSSVFETGSEA